MCGLGSTSFVLPIVLRCVICHSDAHGNLLQVLPAAPSGLMGYRFVAQITDNTVFAIRSRRRFASFGLSGQPMMLLGAVFSLLEKVF